MEKCMNKDCENEAKFFVHGEDCVLRFCLVHYKEFSKKQLEKRIKKIDTVELQPV